ncbi:unnamed protein product [marine sediment metagenome]|uniref:Uncharacterized protein n=1 Tax=marine sediment metagenome TaxID=412755 RepID=X1SD23_9ZZZZ
MPKQLTCPKCGADIIKCPETLDPVRCSKCKKVWLRAECKETRR